MNISSILITLVGIIIIIALYVVSRIGQSNLPKKETTLLPDIKDKNGDVFTSILDDIPASDGSSPVVNKKPQTKNTNDKQQLILFISAKNDQSLDGNLIKKSLLDNGLKIGDKDIYHYLIDNVIESSIASPSVNQNKNKDQKVTSLFRVANGVEPWTLTDQDLDQKQLAGLSMVMLLPTAIENKDALKVFIERAESIAKQTNGILKNQQQKELTLKDRQEIFNV